MSVASVEDGSVFIGLCALMSLLLVTVRESEESIRACVKFKENVLPFLFCLLCLNGCL